MLTHGKDGWFLEDLGSKNGVYLDGARVPALAVVPGAEIRIGEVTLIAESGARPMRLSFHPDQLVVPESAKPIVVDSDVP